MMAEAAPFFWGGSGERISPEAIKRRRAVAAAMLKNGMDYSPVQHWTQGLARVAQALVGGYEEGKLDKAEKANAVADSATSQALVSQLLGGATPSVPPAAATPSTSGGASARSPTGAAPAASFNEIGPRLVSDLKRDFGLTDAQAAGVVGNLAHESAGFGTMQELNPVVPGSRGGFGYAQWTGPRRVAFEGWAKANGLDPTSYDANYGFLRHELANTGEGKVLSDLRAAQDAQAATRIFSDQFLRPGIPGMGSRQQWTQRALAFAPDLIQNLPGRGAPAGSPGDYVRNLPAQAGGAVPANVLQPLAADLPAPSAAPASQETGQPGFAIPPAPQPSMTGQQFNAIHGNDVIPPVFQSEGIGQPWMGTALPQQPAGPTMVAAPLPPSRPADLAMPQADLPAPGAVPAIGQFPTAPMEDLSNAPGAGGREQLVQALMQQQGQSAPGGMTIPPQAAATPVQRVAQAVAGSQGQPAATSDNALAAALVSENPALQRVAQAVLTNRMEGTRGVVMGDRLINPRTGAVIADYSQANGGRSSEFGLNPIYGVDKDGNPVVMQLGKRGDAAATRLPEGVKLARDPIKVDGPTGTTLLDPQTRQQIGFVPKDLAGAEKAKVEGKAQGEAATGLGQALATAEQTLTTIDKIKSHPGRNQWGATGASADWPIIGQGLGGTKGRDFVNLVDQLKGKSFLEAFESLKGGGQITETEGAKATQALARLDRAQSKEGFDEALKDLEDVIRSGMARARQKAGGQAAPRPAAAQPVDTSKPGSYRYNPATGKMEPA